MNMRTALPVGWNAFYRRIGKATGKDWKSIKSLVDNEAIGPDLAEMGDPDATNFLTSAVRKNPRVRNANNRSKS